MIYAMKLVGCFNNVNFSSHIQFNIIFESGYKTLKKFFVFHNLAISHLCSHCLLVLWLFPPVKFTIAIIYTRCCVGLGRTLFQFSVMQHEYRLHFLACIEPT